LLQESGSRQLKEDSQKKEKNLKLKLLKRVSFEIEDRGTDMRVDEGMYICAYLFKDL
jgi:hypothetical protein